MVSDRGSFLEQGRKPALNITSIYECGRRKMKGILLIFFISIVLTAILFSILYVLNDTAWG